MEPRSYFIQVKIRIDNLSSFGAFLYLDDITDNPTRSKSKT